MRMKKNGELFEWKYRRKGKDIRIKKKGSMVLKRIEKVIKEWIEGLGIEYMKRDYEERNIERGEIVEVMEEWRKNLEG